MMKLYLNYNLENSFIRHAIAPGNGDPENFNILDCSTQNLSEEGIKQSKKIGIFL